ncbi:MAG TPA: carboxypeptidase-like regulatory domain-containing protein [Bryobacteraceae bacterium]|nr:carboxypeptidase-like regulatory domain-containing protein [Bryobacteraceae bacterium]
MPKLLLFLPFLCASLVSAQNFAAISGVVTDTTARPVEAAAVTAKNTDTGIERRTTTNAEGQYRLLLLPLGRYTLTVEKAAFKSAVRSSVDLTIGEQAVIDFSLELGAIRQQVVVNGDAPLVSTAMSNAEGLVDERAVKDLPLNGRSYDQLITLNPGTVNYTSQKTGGIGVSNSAVGNMFAVSGRRPQENLFLIDGVEYTGAAEINMQPGGTSGQLLGVDAVREFNVLTNTYGAEYGKRPAAQVIVATQSGTNEVHGSLYDYFRNSALDARNFFDRSSVPRFGRNQFGAALGGPLKKNKTFLFGNYEGFRQHLGLSNVTLVPDNNARQGLLPGPNGTLINVGLAPGVAQLLSFWPVANGPNLGDGIAEAFSSPQQTIREDFGAARFDQIISTKDTLTGSYTVDDSYDYTPTPNPLSLDIESLREQVASLHETHVFSPDVLNNIGAGFSRASYFYTGAPAFDSSGFIESRPMGALVIGGNATPNTPSAISLAGSNYGSNLFITRNLFTYYDSLLIVKGIHQIQAGVWFQRVQANDAEALGQYGQATFASLQSFLQGIITTFTAVPNPTPLGWRSLESAFYIQDQMRLSPRLTLSLGFRAESTNGWNEVSGRAANFVFGANGILQTQPRIASSAFTVNNAQFLPEPRAGLAWDPFGRRRTVIRAGFGMYNALQDALSYRLDQNAPFNTSTTIRNASVSALKIVPGEPLPANSVVSPAGVQPDLQTPTVIAYTLKLQQAIGANTVLNVGYAGSHAYHEIVSVDTNQPFATVCPAAPCPASYPTGTAYYPPNAPLRNPRLGSAWTWVSEGISSYNALQVDVNRRFSNGLQLRGIYTWSKVLDTGDTLNGSAAANAPGLVMNADNLAGDKGRGTFDIAHAAAISGTYELPVGRGRKFLNSGRGPAQMLLGGWSLNAIAMLHSGFPFTPEMSFNPSNNGNTTNPIRPSLNPAFQGKIIEGSPNRWFNPNAFVVPPNGTYGNLGRNVLDGPGLSEVDLSLMKDMRLSERWNLQFRAEAFNVFNTANFNTPNLITFTSANAPPSTTAGVITSTATTSRQLQLALKVLW